MNATLLVTAWLLPLLLIVPARRQSGRFVPALAVLPALTTAVVVPQGTEVAIPWLLLGVQFGLDDVPAFFCSSLPRCGWSPGCKQAHKYTITLGAFACFLFSQWPATSCSSSARI